MLPIYPQSMSGLRGLEADILIAEDVATMEGAELATYLRYPTLLEGYRAWRIQEAMASDTEDDEEE